LPLYEKACFYQYDEKCYRQIAYVLYLLNHFDKSVEKLNKGIQEFPKSGLLYHIKCKILMDGFFDLSGALESCNKAVEFDDKAATHFFMRGVVHLKQKSNENAKKDFDKAIEIYPKYAVAYENRGIVYSREKNWEKAISDYTSAIDNGFNTHTVYVYRCTAFERIQQYDKAIRDCEKALSLMPENDPTKASITDKVQQMKQMFNSEL